MNVKKIIYWVLTGLIALVFIATAFQKLNSLSDVAFVESVGGRNNLIALAVMELVFAVLFIIPRTGVIGSLFLIAYMGGAIAVHFVANESIAAQVGIQVAVWLVAMYRFPELRKRICGCASSCRNKAEV